MTYKLLLFKVFNNIKKLILRKSIYNIKIFSYQKNLENVIKRTILYNYDKDLMKKMLYYWRKFIENKRYIKIIGMKITHDRNTTLKKFYYRFWIKITVPLIELNKLLYYGKLRKNRKFKLNIILCWKK
jgi:hypothetical protein